MIDELVGFLNDESSPDYSRLDSHSVELCRGAAEIELILHSFKAGGSFDDRCPRDILGKDTIETIHQAIGDTAGVVPSAYIGI